MEDHIHRRTTSEVVASSKAPVTGGAYGCKQAALNQRSFETNSIAPASSTTHANAAFHLRSQSYESSCKMDYRLGREPLATPPTRHSRYGKLLSAESAESYPRHMHLAQLDMQRRGSESSTSSAVSACTTTAGGTSSWSAATTPETMSPTSPNNSLLLRSPPENNLEKTGTGSALLPASPSRTGQQGSTLCRQSQSRACSHSVPKRPPNSLFESTVPEEDERTEMMRGNARRHQKMASYESNVPQASTTPAAGLLREAKSASNLRQRRQQRQQKVGEKPQAKQPVRLRLSPLPPLPLDQQSDRRLSTTSPRTLQPSRSSPQLRIAAGPPPTGPLPPLPRMSAVTPTYLPLPPTPLTSPNPDAHPACPVGPPPPPPSRPPPDSPGLAASPLDCSAMLQQQSQSWEEELKRHKKLLEQFPSESKQRQELPRLSRTHRSLGNIRARSRSLSRATGVSLQDDIMISEPRLSHHASSFNLRGSKMQRPATAKPTKDSKGRRHDDQGCTSQAGTPHVSVFEDDSEEEGDAVRKFVRSFFTRRTRGSEVPTPKQQITTEQVHEVFSGSQYAAVPANAYEGNRHNDRKKNHSTSSALSMATTVDVDTHLSTASTLVPANTEDWKNGREAVAHPEGGNNPSPRGSSDQPRQQQRGPLLSRMFVRRSR